MSLKPEQDNVRKTSTFSIDLLDFKLPSDYDGYEIGCKMGYGSYGSSVLMLAKLKESVVDDLNKLFLMRRTKIDQLSSDGLRELQEELQLLSTVQHPNILCYYSAFVHKDTICTVFPFYNYGSCHDLITSEFHHGLPMKLIAVIVRSVVLALEHLHNLRIVHRAVQASHILLSSNGRVCLSGLRYSYQLPEHTDIAHNYPRHAVQMLPWTSPEILQQNLSGYSFPSDIYSLGITVCELATGVVPFNKMKATEILLQKVCGVVPQLPDTSTLCDMQADSQTSLDGLESDNTEYTTATPQLHKHKRVRRLQQLVEACLQTDPVNRPTSYQLHHCLYIRHIKRKQKEKDFPSLNELLQPLTPVLEFLPNKSTGGDTDEMLSERLSQVSVNSWVL